MWGGDPSADIIPSFPLALEDIIFYSSSLLTFEFPLFTFHITHSDTHTHTTIFTLQIRKLVLHAIKVTNMQNEK